ncbi:MAG TPA: hypothetical protein VFB67_10655 [Candidatus Polarisedimenticolaceae bacterium]|nr:hypothetical protein [Candidatus Polarisedimenticolaceae bacterium]
MTAERDRLAEAPSTRSPWKRWGPYVSERQWGTVREDYSAGGTAWDSFPHDHARSRAYRWGEDGLAGISDDRQRLCLSLALWNGRDPILKERLFGLTNAEGNHGEDVKEVYHFLDATPTHAYLKMLYRYPRAEFPYARLVEENRRRGRDRPELELSDTGVFDDGRFFDVIVEYAKAAPNDILMRVTAWNRDAETATIHVVPQLLFRNTWSWTLGAEADKPSIERSNDGLDARHPGLGPFHLSCEGRPRLLLTENETNVRRLYGVTAVEGPFKDAFHEAIVEGREPADRSSGTKAAAWYPLEVPAGGSRSIRLRLADRRSSEPWQDFDRVFTRRIEEADAFFEEVQRGIADPDARRVQRQAFAGLIWSKQYYRYDVRAWLAGDPAQPRPPDRSHGRNAEWTHLNAAEVLSVPDAWEFPWFAAWDLAFHCIPLALVDPEFAKEQLVALTREWYMHPNGQLPAYEWAFGDANPPVHAWAAWRVFQIDRKSRGDAGDLPFLERVFHKLMLNFTWWVNRKDAEGRNLFQGGFLGLDNIGVFDRSAPLPPGTLIHQADGTSWMAMYSLSLMRIALELARSNPVYQDVATKFFEHFLQIAEAMSRMGEGGLWDEADGFFYDVLSLPGGRQVPLKVRSMVGLIPLFAVEVIEPDLLDALPDFAKRLRWYLDHRPDLAALVSRWHVPGRGERRLLSLLRGHRMKRLLLRALDESEFLSPFGVRSLSKAHAARPFTLEVDGGRMEVAYEPGPSTSSLFGGNSNWRGPVWFPVNYLLIESLQRFHHYYGDDFLIECPVGSGRTVTIAEAAAELTRRLTSLFLLDEKGERPALGGPAEHLLFHEYFDGDSGRGLGASHQTGWTALVAKLLQPRRGPRVAAGAPLLDPATT